MFILTESIWLSNYLDLLENFRGLLRGCIDADLFVYRIHYATLQWLTQLYLGDLYAESGHTLEGSFSAVSKPNFASKYSLELAICSKRRLRKGTWGETEK